ncbi:hypothetical protein [Mesorhizobium sp. M0187]
MAELGHGSTTTPQRLKDSHDSAIGDAMLACKARNQFSFLLSVCHDRVL